MTTIHDTLKNDILTAMGTARYLETDTGFPAPEMLRRQLMSLFEQKYGPGEGKEQLEAILPADMQSEAPVLPADGGTAADLFGEFEELDRRFQAQDPAFGTPQYQTSGADLEGTERFLARGAGPELCPESQSPETAG